MKMMKNEEGVSPVIGVILMVAITVILAAVIAVFVFGLAGDLDSSASKDITLTSGTNAAGNVTYTVFAGTDLGTVTNITAAQDETTVVLTEDTPTVGSVYDSTFQKSNGTITVVANFNDGEAQILLQS